GRIPVDRGGSDRGCKGRGLSVCSNPEGGRRLYRSLRRASRTRIRVRILAGRTFLGQGLRDRGSTSRGSFLVRSALCGEIVGRIYARQLCFGTRISKTWLHPFARCAIP